MADVSYKKLETIKEIRNKMIVFSKQNARISFEKEAIDVEKTRLANYHRELALLQQEKLAHVEELRLIHADVNSMEETIKSSEHYLAEMLSKLDHLSSEAEPVSASLVSLKNEIGLDLRNNEAMKSEPVNKNPGSASTLIGIPGAVAPPVLPLIPPPPPPPPSSSISSLGSFHQQPPPMKACQSCHQQIHRNAPICPLCKAKSRSRNPKKSKRAKAD